VDSLAPKIDQALLEEIRAQPRQSRRSR
jgi:hypothetical protein